MRAVSWMLCLAVGCAACIDASDPAVDASSTSLVDVPLETRELPRPGGVSPKQEPMMVPQATPPDRVTKPAIVAEAGEQPRQPERLAARHRERAEFASAAAPRWPFRGLVQLWPAGYRPVETVHEGKAITGLVTYWSLRYWSWAPAMDSYPQVELPGMEINCLGKVALVVHAERGIEVGGAPGAVNAAYFVPWGSTAQRIDEPSEELLAASTSRGGLSNVAVTTQGDLVHVGEGSNGQSYALRQPQRSDGKRWHAQARHDGEIFTLTVHPAHLECYSGVTWLSLAATGHRVACGANTAATAFVAPRQRPTGDLLLPKPTEMGTYLSCAPPLDLGNLPLSPQRQITE